MINGGCVFYFSNIKPYVQGLGLKDIDGNGRKIEEDEWVELLAWFSRFADLLTRGNYDQQWYRKLMFNMRFANN